MIVATNTIKIQSGHVDAVAERFKNPKGVHQAPGFVRMELLKSQEEGYDELKVCTTWESREAFDAWVNSDAFKQAHARPSGAQGGAHPGSAGQPGGTAPQGSSVMLGAKLSVHEVLFSL
ncbi:antibiotic biosynthesis monooxygenase [Cohnella nanjingensis]|uniref:Antibiotic biosynthesis monooxygenase n=1 Tax=Cohnella nanjingensis TaxID=1387779 RepID=A0A7X0RSI7_9BACL|nr:antibiotic biosynthesis monooxygenase [Cohnella nanjingensis]MBB6672741.1 antibiotic biosynthesis monooxygenase [Cohnella nanjingensis]